ncbi:hypothetical protein VP01_5543g1, partial [Puccinia sorghi]
RNGLTQQFNLQAYESGWDNTVLISIYRNGLKENIRIGIVLSGRTFAKLPDIQTLAIQLANEIKASQSPLLTRLTTPIPPQQQIPTPWNGLHRKNQPILQTGATFRP